MARFLPAKPLIVLCVTAILCQANGASGALSRPLDAPSVARSGSEPLAPAHVLNTSSQSALADTAPAADSLGTYFLAVDKVRSLTAASASGGVDPATAQAFDAALMAAAPALEQLAAGQAIERNLTTLRAARQELDRLDATIRQQTAAAPQEAQARYNAIWATLSAQLDAVAQLGAGWEQAGDAQRAQLVPALQSAAAAARDVVRNIMPQSQDTPPPIAPTPSVPRDPGPPKLVSLASAAPAASAAPSASDLAQTIEVQITQEVKDLAASLGNSPVRIYEYVRNNTAFDPYYGSLKGSTAALWTRTGNDYDQASLLLALLRAAGVPSHYVSGVVTMPIQQARDWLGVTDADAASTILRAGGIPAVVIRANGQPSALQLEHVWVEAYVPYDGAGSVWVPLDPSFKLRNYQAGIKLPASVAFNLDTFLASIKPQLAYESFNDQVRAYLQTNITGKTLSDVPYTGEIIPAQLGVVPASLPYAVDAVLNRFGEVPDGLRHKVQIAASGNSSALGPPTLIPTTTLVLAQIALSRVTISFPPDPANSTLARPVLKVEGQTIATATLGMGTAFPLEVRVGLIYPGQGLLEQLTHPADNYARGYRALVFDVGQIGDRLIATRASKLIAALGNVGTPAENQEAVHGELMYLAGLRYFQHLNQAAKSISAIDHVLLSPHVQEAMTYEAFQHPFLASVTQYKIDARGITTAFNAIDGDSSRLLEVRRLFFASGSGLEHQIWEEITQEDAISTVKGLQYARETGQIIYRIDKTNAADLSKVQGLGFVALQISQDIQKGYVITIHGARLNYDQRRTAPWQWSGFAWISEDPTGKGLGCYCISGQVQAPLPAPMLASAARVTLGGATACPECDILPPPLPILGSPPDPQAKVGCPVMLGNGNMFHQLDDIFIPTRGPALQLTRTYNAQSTDNGAFGYGWTYNYNMRLAEIAATGNVTFTNDSGGQYLFVKSGASYTHPTGVFLTLTKVAGGFTLREPAGMTWSFDTTGKLTRIADRNGNAQTLAYDGLGRLATVADALGRRLTFAYTPAGKISSVSDFSGRVWAYTYAANGDLLTSTTPANASTPAYTTSYSYYTQAPWQHDLKAITDPRGQAISFVYDSRDRAFQTIEPEGKVTSFFYMPFRNETEVVTERGLDWIYRYDAKGFITRIARPDGNVIDRTWDSAGDLTRETDGLGFPTSMTYDSRGNMLSVTDALGATTSYAYDPTFSQPTRITDPRGNITTFTVNAANGNTTASLDPLGKTSSFAYDSFGNLTSLTDANGHTTSFAYNANNYLSRVTNGLNHAWTLTRDALGRLTALSDPLNNQSTYGYDALGRVLTASDPLGNTQSFGYDGNDNLLRQTDANGKLTKYTYDGLNNLTTVTDALGNVTQLGYQGPGCTSCTVNTSNLTSLTDANGDTRRYDYDSLDRLVRETDALGRSKSYSYDAQYNLTGSTDEQGNLTRYSYDKVGRLLKAQFADNTTETYSYDLAGNLLSAVNPATTLTYVYDKRDQATQASDSALGKTIGYSYDNVGNRATMTAPDGRALHYAYDPNESLSALTDFAGNLTNFSYDAAERLSQIAPSAGKPGVRTLYGYDTASRLTKLTNSSPNAASSFVDFAYTYDKLGNLATSTATGSSAFGGMLGQTSYSYDSIYRLIGVTPPSTAAQSYGYDAAGNRSQSGPSGATAQSFHDESDQLLYSNASGGTTYTYDERGNLLTKSAGGQTTRYSWNFQNQLTRIDYADGTHSSYAYDALGRRASKTGRDGATTRYLYDGFNILQEYTAAGAVQATYVHPLGIDHPLSMERGGQTSYYMYDRLGSVIGLSDGAGTLKASYVYDAWGNTTGGSDGGIANPYRYTGREYDAESGLYYNRARYYDPQAGRFISRDPIGLAGGANGYAYVGGNPVNGVDSMGLWVAGPVITVSGGAVVGASASGALVSSSSGEIGFQATVAVKMGTTIGGSLTRGGQVSPNAQRLSDLEGGSSFINLSGGEGGVVDAGASFTGSPNNAIQNYWLQGGVGGSASPVNVDTGYSYTWTPFKWQLPFGSEPQAPPKGTICGHITN